MQTIDQRLSELEAVEGSGTQLISLYVPEDKSVQSVINRLQSEYAEAENIKSKSTRQGVQRAIKLAINELRVHGELGTIVFTGVDTDGVEHSFSVHPSEPVRSFRYTCDSVFHTEPYRELRDDRETYALVVIERREATVGRLVGDTIAHVRDLKSNAKGKHNAGGFSNRRFDRVIEESTDDFYDDVSEAVEGEFDPDDLAGVIVGGTNITKDDFTDHLDYRFQDKLISTYSVEYTGEEGLQSLVRQADAEITAHAEESVRETLTDFFTRLRTEDPVTYGREPTKRAVEMGAVETLLISDAKRHNGWQDTVEQVEQMGGEVVEVPDTFEDGNRFCGPFDGIGALLRYPV